jgi:hypothetical protein
LTPAGCEGVVGLGGLSNVPTTEASVGDGGGDANSDIQESAASCGRNGATCGTNLVCYDGACSPCFGGGDCHPGNNACQWGMLDCATGQQECAWTANAPDRTPCVHGSCCAGSCVDPNTDSNACGPTCKPCPGGTSCSGGQCIALFGYSTEFNCNSGFAGLAGKIIFAQQISISSPVTITALGVFGNKPATGLQGAMALYNNSGGGPGTLVTYTNATPIVSGDNRIPVGLATAVSAGTYWIAAEFSANASICGDTSTSNTVEYVSVSFPSPPNPFGSNPTVLSMEDLNFYAVGTE